MLNVNTYIKKSGDACSRFLDAANKQGYLYGSQTHRDADRAMTACLVNGCKAIMLKNGVSFNNTTDEDVLYYAINNFPFGNLIGGIKTLGKTWNDAVKSKNKLFYKQLDCRICNELSELVEYLIQYIKE